MIHIVEITHMVAVYSDDEMHINGHDSAGSRVVVCPDDEALGALECSVAESMDCDSHDTLRVIASLHGWSEAAEVAEALKGALESEAAQCDGEPRDATPYVQEEPLEESMYPEPDE